MWQRARLVMLVLAVGVTGVAVARWSSVMTQSPALTSMPASEEPALTAAASRPVVCDAKAPAADLAFTLRDLQGRDVRLADHLGKVLLIDFWATWCLPCRVEIPFLIDLHDRYQSRGLEVLGLVVQDDFTRAAPFAREWRMAYPILNAIDRPDIETAFGPILGLPTSILVGRDGRVCARHMGIAGLDQLAAEIDALL